MGHENKQKFYLGWKRGLQILRILFIHPVADMYGASRSLLRLVTSLDRSFFESRVILPEKGPLLDLLESRGIAVDVVPYLGVMRRRMLRSWRFVPFIASFFPSMLRIWRIIRRESIDVVHTNTAVTPTPVVSAHFAGVPHVWHMREMFADDFPLFWRYFAPFILHFSDKILCVSTPIKDQFRQNSKLEVLHNGLDTDEFNVTQASVKVWKKKLNVDDGTRLVGVASRISPWKGQDIFLKACVLLKGKARNVKYLIIGGAFEGNEYLVEMLNGFVTENNLGDEVTFTGFVEEPKSLIAALDILVLPSTRPDPFPGVVLEAMALGVPIVATNIGGPIEQVEHGITGLLVAPSDPESIATAILELIDDPDRRQAMGRAGRERVTREFALTATHRRIEEIYRDLSRK